MSNQNLAVVRAVRDSLYTEMNLNGKVLVIGEDISRNGGIFRAMEGLWNEPGDNRIVDTSLTGSGIVDTAIDMTAMGLKPVPEIQFSGFMYPGFNQIMSHMGRFRNRTRGRYTLPIVLRAPYGGGIRAPESYSESKEMFYAHEVGLRVVIPSTPYDTRGLSISTIRDPGPVIFMEPELIYRVFRGGVPEDDYTVPVDKVAVRREDMDVSMFTFGAMTRLMLETVENLEERGTDAGVVGVRTVSPLGRETIVESFKKTDHAVVVHEAPKNGGPRAEITAVVQEEALLCQETPVRRVADYDVPYPLYMLEDYCLPSAARVEKGIREAVNL